MNIVMIHSGPLNPDSGGGIHTLELFENLTRRNNVKCFLAKSNLYKINNKNFIFIPFINFSALRLLSYNLVLFMHLLYYCKKTKQDIIYVRKNGINPASIIISKIFSIPLVFEVNGILIDDVKSLTKQRHLSLGRILYITELYEYRQSDKIVAVTDGIKNYILNNYKISEDKIVVVENGTNEKVFRPIRKDEAIEKLGLSKSHKYISFVGGLAPWHGVEYLILSVPQVIKEAKGIIFLIVGEGPEKDRLIRLVHDLDLSNHVIFVGRVKNDLVPYYINASEVCVAPFTIDRNVKIGISPLKIYEYLACGKLVITSDIPGVRDVINSSGGGVVVEAERPDILGEAIINIISGKYFPNSEGSIRDYILRNHTWSEVAKKIESIFESLTISQASSAGKR